MKNGNVCRFWERSRNRLQAKELGKNFFSSSCSLSLLHQHDVELKKKNYENTPLFL